VNAKVLFIQTEEVNSMNESTKPDSVLISEHGDRTLPDEKYDRLARILLAEVAKELWPHGEFLEEMKLVLNQTGLPTHDKNLILGNIVLDGCGVAEKQIRTHTRQNRCSRIFLEGVYKHYLNGSEFSRSKFISAIHRSLERMTDLKDSIKIWLHAELLLSAND